MNYEKLYRELKEACVNYHSAYPGSTLKAEAYATLCKHMDGSRVANAKRAAAARVAMNEFAEYDAYMASVEGDSSRGQR